MQLFLLVIIIILIWMLPWYICPLFCLLYAGIVSLSLAIFSLLDEVCSARLLPGAPWLLWMLWGALIGASLGFWTVAPVFGLRKHRSLIGIAPHIRWHLGGWCG